MWAGRPPRGSVGRAARCVPRPAGRPRLHAQREANARLGTLLATDRLRATLRDFPLTMRRPRGAACAGGRRSGTFVWLSFSFSAASSLDDAGSAPAGRATEPSVRRRPAGRRAAPPLLKRALACRCVTPRYAGTLASIAAASAGRRALPLPPLPSPPHPVAVVF